LELSVGTGGLTQAFVDNGVWATAHLALRLERRWRVGLVGGLGTQSTRIADVRTLGTGQAWAVPFAVELEGGACTSWAVELCGSAVAGVRGARGGGAPPLFRVKSDTWIASPDLGVAARAQWRPWHGFFVAAEATLAFPLVQDALQVEGVDHPDLGLQRFDLRASLQLGWSWPF
jgi:hypothetical protein